MLSSNPNFVTKPDGTINKLVQIAQRPSFYVPFEYRNYRLDVSGGGSGYLGIVRKFDSADGTTSIAIKKFTLPFQDGNRAKLILRELNLLSNMRHPNIVRFLKCYSAADNAADIAQTPDKIDTIYHITEHCGESLTNVIREGAYTMKNVKRWTGELLSALNYLNSVDIIHRDLKPDAMCISKNEQLSLIGFGRARALERGVAMTAERGTRPYEALEMRVEWNGPYDEKVDIWSMAVILCEMITGAELFSGKNPIKKMIEFCGPVDQAVLAKMKDSFEIEMFVRASVNAKRKDFIQLLISQIHGPRAIQSQDIEAESQLADFIDRTLQFIPDNRMSAATAAAHPFLSGVTISGKQDQDETDNEADLQASRQLFWDTFLAVTGKSEERFLTHILDLSFSDPLDQSKSAENQMREYLNAESNKQPQPKVEKEFTSQFLSSFNPVKVLGQGGYGCVFAVEQNLDGKVHWTRAVKRIPGRGKTGDVDDSLKEVAALLSFDHPGIVRFYNAWKEVPPPEWQRIEDEKLSEKLNFKYFNPYKDDCAFLYIEMELCESTLTKWLRKNTTRDLDIMKSWFVQIVEAVRYIHSKGYIHRDLKPSNILFKEGRLKICDLGIVTDRETMNAEGGQEEAKSRTARLGSPLYMAPEQKSWTGVYSSKVDIFALGLILTELCVVMAVDQLADVFNNFRDEKPNSVLDHLPELKEFVALMTNATDTERPDCGQILAHSFLSPRSQNLG